MEIKHNCKIPGIDYHVCNFCSKYLELKQNLMDKITLLELHKETDQQMMFMKGKQESLNWGNVGITQLQAANIRMLR